MQQTPIFSTCIFHILIDSTNIDMLELGSWDMAATRPTNISALVEFVFDWQIMWLYLCQGVLKNWWVTDIARVTYPSHILPLSLLREMSIPNRLILSESVGQAPSSFTRLGRHSSIYDDFQRHVTTRGVSYEALGVQEVESGHSEVPLWISPPEVVKIKREKMKN